MKKTEKKGVTIIHGAELGKGGHYRLDREGVAPIAKSAQDVRSVMALIEGWVDNKVPDKMVALRGARVLERVFKRLEAVLGQLVK